MKTFLSRLLSRTPLQYLGVRVRKGVAKGAKWTLLPFSANWREGGESDLQAAISVVGDMKGLCCWDFGAHFGIHTVGMAMKVGPSGEVAAFEPDPVAFARLTRHIRMNHLSWVKLFQAGVSRTMADAEMIISEGEGSTFTHFRYEDEPASSINQTIRVKIVAPDALVDRREIRLPDFIKVDVQGHGAQALAGSRESIEKNRPTILFSSHSHWELEGAKALLQPMRYRPYDLRGDPTPWEAFVNGSAILRPGLSG